jgi:hypothetical protein
LCHVFRPRKTPNPSNRVRSQKSNCCTYATFCKQKLYCKDNFLSSKCVSHAPITPTTFEWEASTVGACRQTGGKLSITINICYSISSLLLLVPRSVNSRKSYH